MAAKVIMPALGMAQEFGKLIAWLKQEGDDVSKGEPLIEIETDKATVEFDAQASGVLAGIRAVPGQEVPVGEVIAWILQPGEEIPEQEPIVPIVEQGELPHVPNEQPEAAISNGSVGAGIQAPLEISPVARNIAMEHGIDLNQIKVNGNRVQKADVLRYIEEAKKPEFAGSRLLASPKARRLAAEQGISLGLIIGSGPDGAVLAEDVMGYATADNASLRTPGGRSAAQLTGEFEMSKAWEVMAGRLTEAWRTIPHFYLEREIDASQMVVWRRTAQEKSESKITFTDLLTKAVASALAKHPRVNASWINGAIQPNPGIHVGIAVATGDGLVVPAIPYTNELSVSQIAKERAGIVSRALEGKLKMQDMQGGTFTISNLGMYGVERFSAIVNPPQAAILAVGKIIEKAVPVNGKVDIKPTLVLTLSCDHRVVDGARGAQFLDTLANYLEQPLSLF